MVCDVGEARGLSLRVLALHVCCRCLDEEDHAALEQPGKLLLLGLFAVVN